MELPVRVMYGFPRSTLFDLRKLRMLVKAGIDSEFGCECKTFQLTWKLMTNGVSMYRLQCVRCGRKGLGPIGFRKAWALVSEGVQMHPFDQALYDEWYRRKREAYHAYGLLLEDGDTYSKYLASAEWRMVRNAVMDARGGRCQRCGDSASQVHHLTYERLGEELPSDLECLCSFCHANEHGMLSSGGAQCQ